MMAKKQEAPTQPPSKPKPTIFPFSQSYWEGTQKGELRIQQCVSCSHRQFYPRSACENCGNRKFDWIKCSGKGTIHSYTIIREVVMNSPAFEKEIPYVLSIIELEEGVRMVAQVVDCKIEDVRIGMPVGISAFEPLNGVSVVKFKSLM